ncbi:MAG: hypothetical protein ABI835_13645, partial [Chloroflexota bacterium]
SGITVIEGSVPSGASREGQAVIFVALALVALAMMLGGSVLFGLLLIPFAAYLYIPLHGDYLNSSLLIDEVEKTLKAKAKPPKAAAISKTAKTPARSSAAVSTTKRTPAKKPATTPVRSATRAVPKPKPAAPPADEFPATDEFPTAGAVGPLADDSF